MERSGRDSNSRSASAHNALRVAYLRGSVSSHDFLVRRSRIRMMLPTNDIGRAFDRMFSDPPTALDVAVMPPVYRNQAADNRDFAEVRTKSRPEPVPRAGEVVGPHHMKDPVPHEATPIWDLRRVGHSFRHSGIGLASGVGMIGEHPNEV